MSVKILLADDHGIMRPGLRSLIEKEPEMQVVAEDEDGRKTHSHTGYRKCWAKAREKFSFSGLQDFLHGPSFRQA